VGESGDAGVGDATSRVAPADGRRREVRVRGLLAIEGTLADVTVVVLRSASSSSLRYS
jgi:hypothetical protein